MSIGRTILDCKLALCHLASDMKYAGAVYEARTYGSVRGMRQKPHPTRCAFNLIYYYLVTKVVQNLSLNSVKLLIVKLFYCWF